MLQGAVYSMLEIGVPFDAGPGKTGGGIHATLLAMSIDLQ
jgi:hypothetical protein